ncbi:MAG: hypothetical protein DMG57_27590 [Acidobacteria bacterium]|nr:MAG: hypothetical protein DMG57_27590 [Acidobacteriota bacterium]
MGQIDGVHVDRETAENSTVAVLSACARVSEPRPEDSPFSFLNEDMQTTISPSPAWPRGFVVKGGRQACVDFDGARGELRFESREAASVA